MKKVVLAYSGGLDTSVAVAWLREQYDAEVVTLTVDLGGGVLKEDVDRRAISAGASRAYVVDGRERFVRDFCWPHVQAGAMYQGVYPLATAMARPLIARRSTSSLRTPPPRSTVRVTTSTSYCSRNQATATDVSSPPE